MRYNGRARRMRSENPYWSDIDRCHTRLTELSRQDKEIPINAKAQSLVNDLFRRGESYTMTEPQIRFFTSVAHKLYSNV